MSNEVVEVSTYFVYVQTHYLSFTINVTFSLDCTMTLTPSTISSIAYVLCPSSHTSAHDLLVVILVHVRDADRSQPRNHNLAVLHPA